ncbi:hypothetical protein DDJ70_32405 [Klebsiella michiganensis]|uniref:plasmid partition protein ParG n=1 Tax=Klebsiella michiganensis TaxID=1134687 RepID=UPI000E2A1B0A|nr:hypothetical protein DDJ70_32405 [Klebsiella michiganensis]
MSKFKMATKGSDAVKPVSRDEFAGGAAMVQSQVGNRPLKPVRVNFDLDPDEHRRLKMRAVEAGISIADLVRGLIRKEIS